MEFGNVSKVMVVDDEAANDHLKNGWVFLSAAYVPGTEKESGHFNILLGLPREKDEVARS